MRALVSTLVLVLGTQLVAQQAPTPTPRRSLADGLVRQRIELEGLRPPHLDGGQELAAGKGHLALLVRHADGTLKVEPLARGDGDHGAPATPPTTPVQAPRMAAPAGARPGPPPAGAEPLPTLLLEIRRDGDGVTLTLPGQTPVWHKRPLDGAALTAILRERQRTMVAELMIAPDPEVSMQDVLTTIASARAAGAPSLYFAGIAAAKNLPPEQEQTIAAIPTQCEWHGQPFGQMTLYDDELLLLVDGAASWGDIGPIYMACARAGIWQVAFVGQQDAATRWKLPVHLPVDRDR